MRTKNGTNASKTRTTTSRSSQVDCSVVKDPADIINKMLSKLLPWHYFELLAVTPWSVRFLIEGADLYASNETDWLICPTGPEIDPFHQQLCVRLNYLLTRDCPKGHSLQPGARRLDTFVSEESPEDDQYPKVEVLDDEKIVVHLDPGGAKFIRLRYPGEGYRWLRPGERKKPGDEMYDVDMWVETDEPGKVVQECERDTFRRRIEPVSGQSCSQACAGSLDA